MRSFLRLFFGWCLEGTFLLLVVGAAYGKSTAKPKPVKITLPDAYSGISYDTTLEGIEGFATGPLHCSVSTPALPGLALDCSTLHLTGTPADTKSDLLATYVIQVTDVLQHTIQLNLTLTVRPAKETVVVGAKPIPTKAAAGAAAAPDFSHIKFQVTNPIMENASMTAGKILNLPANGPPLNIQVWIKPDNQPAYLASLKPPSTAASTSAITQVPVGADGSYLITFASPLAAGETVKLQLVAPDAVTLPVGEGVSYSTADLSSAIVINSMKLEITSDLVAAATSISGTVTMPIPAIVPTLNSSPPTYGNYPEVTVWTKSPITQNWSQAALLAGTSGATDFIPVNADGSFTVTLKNPLTSGQVVRVDVVAPPGRTFTPTPAPPPPPAAATPGSPSAIAAVKSSLVLAQPAIASPLTEGATTLTGTATPSSSGVSISIAVLRLNSQSSGATTDCVLADQIDPGGYGTFLALTSSASNSLIAPVDSTGAYKVTLAKALKEDDRIQVVQILPAGTDLLPTQTIKCASTPTRVTYPFNWYRTNLTFVAGVLISNSSSGSSTNANFSQANQFYSFNVDHSWRLPGVNCVDDVAFGDEKYGNCDGDGWKASLFPGISTFFESRFTAIPVSTTTATVTSTTGTSSSTPASTPTPTPTLLTSQKTFRVDAGAYLPWVLGHSAGHHPSALFLAPIAKVGFDTLTGAGTASNVILPGNQVGTLSYQNAYNFFDFGGRVGNMDLSASHDRAPMIGQYLDVTVGRYSNLQSFICHRMTVTTTPTNPAGSSCTSNYPGFYMSPGGGLYYQVVDSRKELYRIDMEGLVRIPVPATAIPFYIGFNANIAQHSVGAAYLDHGFAPPDDIRILFGTKFDIGTLLSKFNLGTN
jgi:hypothetical protein